MEQFFKDINPNKSISILDTAIPKTDYCAIDFSVSNKELDEVKISNPEECQKYIDKVLGHNRAKVAYGGYLERRKLYEESELFSGKGGRNIHLGLDFWCSAGTTVLAPMDGTVHSFKNNSEKGDYGPTIILKHAIYGTTFYSLYGHLSIESIEGLTIGQNFRAGQILATLGETEINVNYAPHLHFQLIMDVEDNIGDYPGVCIDNDLAFYTENCPNPNLLLRL